MNVLVTGGTGFIGSHTIIELIEAGHKPFIVDNLCNSRESVLKGLRKISGQDVTFQKLDILDTEELAQYMKKNNIQLVIHFAALKAVGESIDKPLEYYSNNVTGLLSVLEAMEAAGVNNLIFSSSATVYGAPDSVPITEDFPLKPPTNPYGASKQMCEQIIQDVCKATSLRAILLRYFNPVGAHPSGLIGELPLGTPSNLVPYVAQAAAGVQDTLAIHGDNYNTPDGTGVRDYVHVVDLAKAHVKSIEYLESKSNEENVSVFNIGSGHGTSVLEIINTFQETNNTKVPYRIGPKRPGDIATVYASAAKAEKLLKWKAELTLAQALEDAWRWQRHNNKDI